MVSQQSFQHFDFISMVDKSTDLGNIVVDLLFTTAFTVFDVQLGGSFSWKSCAKTEKNKLRHHHVISTVCTLIDRSSRPIIVRVIGQLL